MLLAFGFALLLAALVFATISPASAVIRRASLVLGLLGFALGLTGLLLLEPDEPQTPPMPDYADRQGTIDPAATIP